MVMFSNTHLVSHEAMRPHIEALRLLSIIVDIYRLGDRILDHLVELDAVHDTYTDAYRHLYPDCETPKLHIGGHIPLQMRKKGKHLTA